MKLDGQVPKRIFFGPGMQGGIDNRFYRAVGYSKH